MNYPLVSKSRFHTVASELSDGEVLMVFCEFGEKVINVPPEVDCILGVKMWNNGRYGSTRDLSEFVNDDEANFYAKGDLLLETSANLSKPVMYFMRFHSQKNPARNVSMRMWQVCLTALRRVD